MGSARKRRRLVGFRRQLDRDEDLGRFGRLILGVIALEAIAFVWITGGFRLLG